MYNHPPNAPKSCSGSQPTQGSGLGSSCRGLSPAQGWDPIPALRSPHTRANSSSGWNGVKGETWQMFLLSPAPRLLRC